MSLLDDLTYLEAKMVTVCCKCGKELRSGIVKTTDSDFVKAALLKEGMLISHGLCERCVDDVNREMEEVLNFTKEARTCSL